jgi:hypothetical protein
MVAPLSCRVGLKSGIGGRQGQPRTRHLSKSTKPQQTRRDFPLWCSKTRRPMNYLTDQYRA